MELVGGLFVLLAAVKEFRKPDADKSRARKEVLVCAMFFVASFITFVAVSLDADSKNSDDAAFRFVTNKLGQDEAQLELLQKTQEPRWLKLSDCFLDKKLEGKPSGGAEILYPPDDDESQKLASIIDRGLSGGSWSSGHPPRPIPFTLIAPKLRNWPQRAIRDMTLEQRATGVGLSSDDRIVLVSNGSNVGSNSPLEVLSMAFTECGFRPYPVIDPLLDSNVIRIIILKKP
jgi:hypothetical protein